MSGSKNFGAWLVVNKPRGWRIRTGDSIAVNGVCSTVKGLTNSTLRFEYMPETLARSTLLGLNKGDKVNMEQSLRLSERLDGHIVQGHVDTVGVIRKLTQEGNSVIFTIEIPQSFRCYVAVKGSVTIDGVSLTVADVSKKYFTVKIIPYTLTHTNLQSKKMGSEVNVEVDVVAKYVERLLTI